MTAIPAAPRDTLAASLRTGASLRRSDLDGLHPWMRRAALELLRLSDAAELGFRLFEAFRSPHRQSWLYQHGRELPGTKVVTHAQAWSSYHQYGLAGDFVLYVDQRWSWNTTGAWMNRWERLHQLGTSLGLEPLSFELPHLQLAGLKLEDLKAGRFPPGGDQAWRDNIAAAANAWVGPPAAPPLDVLR